MVMTNRKIFEIPHVGQRFELAGEEREITHSDNRSVRITTVKGGKQIIVPLERYISLTENANFKFIKHFNPNGDHSEKVGSEMHRRLNYVQTILANTIHPYSKNIVQPIIVEIAKKDSTKVPGLSSVFKWIKEYIDSGYNPNSILMKTKKRKPKESQFGHEVEHAIQVSIDNKYLNENRNSALFVAENIHLELPFMNNLDPKFIKIPSVRTLRRRIQLIDPYKVLKKRHGVAIARKLNKAAGISKVTDRALEVVEADGNLMDVILIDPSQYIDIGRPYLTLIIDRNTRCILAFYITLMPFSSTTLLKTLKEAFNEDNGLPGGAIETIVFDNGSDYTSQSVKNLLSSTRTTIEFGEPGQPNTKPFVERVFRTLNSKLIHRLPGTTFSNPNDRGEYESLKKCSISLEDLEKIVSETINIYHHEYHTGLKDCPLLSWEKSKKRQPIAQHQACDIDLYAKTVSRRSINNGRIRKYNLFWYSHALATIEQKLKAQGKPTIVDLYLDELDLSYVLIRDPFDDSNYIQANSTVPEYTNNLSLYEHKIVEDKHRAYRHSDKVMASEKLAIDLRRQLWTDINEQYGENKRRNKRLTNGNKRKAIQDRKTIIEEDRSNDHPIDLIVPTNKVVTISKHLSSPNYIEDTDLYIAEEL